jgi:DNA mismatch endonuclease, patch repair protein
VRKSMIANKGRDTSIELAVRRELFARGYRYRVNHRPLPSLRRTADIAFTRRRVAIFIDGCFWHGCPEHYTAPKANSDYWSSKIVANMRRDQETNERLTAEGWKVLRFWEHQPRDEVVLAIVRQLQAPE